MRENTTQRGVVQTLVSPTRKSNEINMNNRNMKIKAEESSWAKLTFAASVALFALIYSTANTWAKGGDLLWPDPFQDVQVNQTQEAMVSAIDSAGNLIISGYQDVSGNSDDDFYTIKLSSDGENVLWSSVYAGSGGDWDWVTNIAIDGNDDIIVNGFSFNGVNDDIVTIKYSGDNGNQEWIHIYNGSSNANDYPNSLSLDDSGNVYVAGYTQSGGGNADEALLYKLSTTGEFVWPQVKITNVTAAGNDRFNDVQVGTSGVVVTGYTTLTAHGGGAADYDYLTVMYSDNGTLIWQETYDNGYGADEARYVDIDSSGNVIISGQVLGNAGRTDIYTLKYPAEGGSVLWSTTYSAGSPNRPRGIAIDGNDDLYLLGYTFTNDGLDDFYTAKYDGSSGAVLWEDVYDSKTNHDDSAETLALDNDGGLFVTGFADKDGGDSDFLTLKYNTSNGSLLWSDMHDSTEGGDQQTVGVAVGLGISAMGDVYVAGWTQSTTNIDDLDYYAIKYDGGSLNRPTDLVVVSRTVDQVDLAWVDNSYDPDPENPKNEDHFCVERCSGYACDFTTIDLTDCTIAANETVYSDDSVNKDTWYSYRVYGNNESVHDPVNNTHASNVVAVLTTVIAFPEPAWVYSYDNDSDDYECVSDPSIPSCKLDDMARAIDVGSDHNPVVTGMSASVNNQYDYYTVKIDRLQPATPIWTDKYNGPDGQGDVGTCLSVDADGDVVVSGYSSRDSGSVAGNTNDIYTIKYAAEGPDQYTGEPLWATHYNGPGNDDDRSEAVATAAEGSNYIAVVGYGKNMALTGNDDIYLIKYEPDFAGMNVEQKVWEIEPYDGGYNDYPSAVTFDLNGDVVVVGRSYNAAGDSDIFINKYSGADGSQVSDQNWPVLIDSGYGDDEIKAVTVDSVGNIYVAGFVSNAAGNRDWYINKFSSTGAQIWSAKTVDGGSDLNDYAIDIVIDVSDGAIVVGGTVVNVTGSQDFHVVRLTEDGTIMWQKTLDLLESTDQLVDMALSPSGVISLVGNSCQVGNDCRPGEISQGANPDVMVVMYNHLGDIVSSTMYDGLYNDYATSVVANTLGEFFVAGYSSTGFQANDDYDFLAINYGINKIT